MTAEGPDGMRYLVYRDGTLVRDGDGRPRPTRLDSLDPASRRIVQALVEAKRSAERRASGGPGHGGDDTA